MAEIDRGAVSGITLMERAGAGVVAAIFDVWPELSGAPGPAGWRALVLCGPGNNGGDGFVVARLLAGLGWHVEVALSGDPARLKGDAKLNHTRWDGLGVTRDLAAMDRQDPGFAAVDLVVDALFGTGLVRPLSAALDTALKHALKRGARSVAVDILSGLCADSGKVLGGGPAAQVDLSVTFHTAKPGHVLGAGAGASGALRIVDIGLDPGRDLAVGEVPIARLLDAADFARPVALKAVQAHKFGHGHALVLSGGPGRTGAARLAARAALRIGAGLVTLGVPPAAQQEVAMQITALMLARVPDADALKHLLEDPRYSALCLGPGLGLSAATKALVRVALNADRAVVLDADALSIFSDDPQALFGQLQGRRAVLTPHAGEFARLFPDLADRLGEVAALGPAESVLDVVRAASRRAGCVVLLKGASTVIAAPDGQCHVHAALRDRAAPWLATAGSGDVLAGMITGLLARGFAPLEAAGLAGWLHVSCARHVGPGLIAEDLPEALPSVLRQLL